MPGAYLKKYLLLLYVLFFTALTVNAQNNFKLKFKNSAVYAGIEVGSKGVKMSILEIGKNAQKNGSFNALKDTSVNTDFISFNESSSAATLKGLFGLYYSAIVDYKIPAERIFTAISSGVKVQADKENKNDLIKSLIDSFKIRISDNNRVVSVIDIWQEARLSHIGIVPDSRRYTTFLIDIGSGNTKGGYFPFGNTNDFKLFQLSWGTKSISNATEKRLEDDKTLANYNKQLQRVLTGAENSEIIYRVNESGAYPMSDNIAFSGGIAWSVATLTSPELLDNAVVPVTYDDVVKLNERVLRNYTSISDSAIARSITNKELDKKAIAREVRRVNQVFDQRALLAGMGLLLKIMRQFEGVYEKKQFYLVKNGSVGWISAFVDQTIANK
jgi:hypothetical protein